MQLSWAGTWQLLLALCLLPWPFWLPQTVVCGLSPCCLSGARTETYRGAKLGHGLA